MLFKKKIFGLHIYISSKRMRQRQDRDFRGSKKWWTIHYIKPFIEQTRNHCMICGKYDDHCGIHHVLPVCAYPELERCKENMLWICPECHRTIHHNPYLMGKMILKKINELGVENKYAIDHEKEKLFIQG